MSNKYTNIVSPLRDESYDIEYFSKIEYIRLFEKFCNLNFVEDLDYIKIISDIMSNTLLETYCYGNKDVDLRLQKAEEYKKYINIMCNFVDQYYERDVENKENISSTDTDEYINEYEYIDEECYNYVEEDEIKYFDETLQQYIVCKIN